MKTIVTYMSQTGNTKRIAESIFEEIKGEKVIKEISEIDSLDGYDLVFVGFPIISFGTPEPVKEFMGKYLKDKNVALFITHAVPEGFEALDDWISSCKAAANGANIVGVFNCQGELAQPVIDTLLKSDDPQMRAFGEMGPMTKGQPDSSRIEKARAFAKEIMSAAE